MMSNERVRPGGVLGRQNRRDRPDAEEVTAVVDVRDQVEVGHRLGHHAVGAQHSGVGHEHVQTAEQRGHLRDRRELRLLVGDVHLDRHRPAGPVLER